MSTIEFSPSFGVKYANRCAGKNTTATTNPRKPFAYGLLQSNDTYQNASMNAHGFISIMKGTAPADFSTLIDATSRSTDKLIVFSVVAGDFAPTVDNVNPIIVNTSYVAASITGTASWFWWYVKNADDNSLQHQVIGSVGVVGSGSDLEIPDVNLISGTAYRILNLRLQFPTTWTY